VTALAVRLAAMLATPPAERLRDGVKVVIAGPPNAGKSTLINALSQRDAAIVSDIAGTTRDVIEVPVAIGGVPFRLTDTAGLHDGDGDAIEAIGMDRARDRMSDADIILWLGEPDIMPDAPHAVIARIAAQADRHDRADQQWQARCAKCDLILSAMTGEGMDNLTAWLLSTAATLLPKPSETAVNQRQRNALADAYRALATNGASNDPLILAEHLREARVAIDRVTGKAGTEAMLDALFGRFCIGK
jgi:tRNA modification GTPase